MKNDLVILHALKVTYLLFYADYFTIIYSYVWKLQHMLKKKRFVADFYREIRRKDFITKKFP